MSGTTFSFPPVPVFLKSGDEHRRQIAQVLNKVLQGKLNATLTGVTLTANVASTTITDERVGYYTFVALMPTTAHAAAELASGNVYFDTFKAGAGVAGSFVIHHTNNAQTDRTFVALLIG